MNKPAVLVYVFYDAKFGWRECKLFTKANLHISKIGITFANTYHFYLQIIG